MSCLSNQWVRPLQILYSFNLSAWVQSFFTEKGNPSPSNREKSPSHIPNPPIILFGLSSLVLITLICSSAEPSFLVKQLLAILCGFSCRQWVNWIIKVEVSSFVCKERNPMQESQPVLPKPASFHAGAKLDRVGISLFQGFGPSSVKKRGHGSRSWIQIDRSGKSQIVALDKAALMRQSGLPARDLRLLDPLFVYPSTILGREKAIVVSLEQIRCIITAEEVLLMHSLDNVVLQYESELCQRLQMMKDQTDDLPFEFKALELALEMASTSLDAQVTQLEIEVYPVLEELASSISTINLEHVRRLKSQLLALTHRVQKVHDEIEQLMDDDGDMAEMYLTEKKERMEAYSSTDRFFGNVLPITSGTRSAPVSPTCSSDGQPEKTSGSVVMSFSRQGSSRSSYNNGRNVEELEMLLEAYFVVIESTLSKLLSLKEYIDDTEDFINIKLDNVRNQLIQFELLLSAATFVVTIFAVVTGVFGMNFEDSVFDHASNFNWVLILSGLACGVIYSSFLLYVKHKRLLPL